MNNEVILGIIETVKWFGMIGLSIAAALIVSGIAYVSWALKVRRDSKVYAKNRRYAIRSEQKVRC